jgi:hypothetical protein
MLIYQAPSERIIDDVRAARAIRKTASISQPDNSLHEQHFEDISYFAYIIFSINYRFRPDPPE